MSNISELEKLLKLKEEGVITSEEFKELKRKVLLESRTDNRLDHDPPYENRARKEFLSFSKLDIVWLVIVVLWVSTQVDSFFLLGFLLFGFLGSYAVLRLILFSISYATRPFLTYGMIGLSAYLLLIESGIRNPFASGADSVEFRIEEAANAFCECVETAKNNANRDKKSKDYFNCVDKHIISYGELNEWIMKADLGPDDEERVRAFFDKMAQRTESCKLSD